ncbi:hypothetical protein RclHR1_16610001 [Rhizophagus clarus]|uniref:Protein kinase domain-containing protein n=1 Tax=Rhizophagus clarus TaxID=94130 RepID=A0A2Z6QIA9_9GLOM|nr:hypothetical protein RclHR1_16610001 [Rhizophagus clarus]
MIYYRFLFGKSQNEILDKFIKEKRLKWIPYNQFEKIEYLDKGGFGTIYKATWLKSGGVVEVALKCFNNFNEDNLNENLEEFLNEWDCHEKCLNSTRIINLYGFTKDLDTRNYMVVMGYANKGSLRGNLTKIVENNWNQKLFILYEIIVGLNEIHNQHLIHCDFHDGNILNHAKDQVFISDLGLCRPVKSLLKKYDIYGVIPFIAPEVLRGNPYTPASDIYSFSMIMWEFTSGVPPFNDRAHELQLSLSICKGERPKIIENTPQCYVDLMKKCWNGDLLKRPSAKEVKNVIESWIFRPSGNKLNEELKSNIMGFINAPIGNNNLITESHPQACYKSRLLDFTSKKVNEILENECSEYIVVDKLSEKLNETEESECLGCIVDNIKSSDYQRAPAENSSRFAANSRELSAEQQGLLQTSAEKSGSAEKQHGIRGICCKISAAKQQVACRWFAANSRELSAEQQGLLQTSAEKSGSAEKQHGIRGICCKISVAKQQDTYCKISRCPAAKYPGGQFPSL